MSLEAEDMKLECVTLDCLWETQDLAEELYTAIYDISAYFNSDFDALTMTLRKVNLNVLVNLNDVSDIIENIVDDKEDSSCLKSLWKFRLCKFLFILTSSKLM